MQVLAILETAIYVRDIATAAAFYERLFALETLDRTDEFLAYSVGGRSVLLLFQSGTTNVSKMLPGGVIPPHSGDGPTHLAFSIPAEDLTGWEQRLTAAGVPIESRMNWPRGGQSIYFRDPDDNLLELVTPGVWAIY